MRRLFFIGILLLITSCATEKVNMSPLSADFSSEATVQPDSRSVGINITENINASEITNLISTFPRFSNSAVNEEVKTLKFTLQNYLYAVESGNTSGKNKTVKSLEKSYKNIQKLRKYLKKDEDEVLNRYLVRLKTNVTVIENAINGKK